MKNSFAEQVFFRWLNENTVFLLEESLIVKSTFKLIATKMEVSRWGRTSCLAVGLMNKKRKIIFKPFPSHPLHLAMRSPKY